jgi:hypothetical protein
MPKARDRAAVEALVRLHPGISYGQIRQITRLKDAKVTSALAELSGIVGRAWVDGSLRYYPIDHTPRQRVELWCGAHVPHPPHSVPVDGPPYRGCPGIPGKSRAVGNLGTAGGGGTGIPIDWAAQQP